MKQSKIEKMMKREERHQKSNSNMSLADKKEKERT